MKSWLSFLLPGRRKAPRSPWRGRFIPQVEQLGERVVPAAPTTMWTNGAGDFLWSTAGNWDNGLPDATKVVLLDGGGTRNTDIRFDASVQATNRTVAGIKTQNGYDHTLDLTSGNALTVAWLDGDTTTGFKWMTPNAKISQSTAQDILVITRGSVAGRPGTAGAGGGADAGGYNKWSAGIIGSGTTQSYLDIKGQSAL